MKLTIFGLIVIIAAASGCSKGQAVDEASAPQTEQMRMTNVEIKLVRTSDLEEYLDLSGSTEALRNIVISSEQGGTVQKVLVDRGDRVRPEQVLALINADIYEAQLAEAEANLRIKEAGLTKARALFERQSITSMQRLQAQVDFDMAEANVKTARARLDRAIVKAPFAGVIDDRFVEPGEMAAPGGPLFHLVDLSRLKIKSEFAEQDVSMFSPGLFAEVRLDAYPDTLFRAQLSFISTSAHQASRTFPCEFILDNRDGLVRSGMFASIRVLKTVHHDVIVLPQTALVETEQGRSVFILNDETAYRRPVRVGASNSGRVVVREGLTPEETVVVTGNRDLVDGQRVRVTGRKD